MTSAKPGSGARRLVGVVLAAFLIAGAAALYAGSQTWQQVTVSRGDPLPDVVKVLYGGTLVPMLTALGVLCIAAVVGLLATGTWGRRLIGTVVLAVGAVTGYLTVQALTADQAAREQTAGQVTETLAAQIAPAINQFAIVAGIGAVLIAAVAAVVTIASAARIPKMGARYDRPSDAPVDGADKESAERERWKALDRGEDPTR